MDRIDNVFIFKSAFDKKRCEDFIHEQIVKPMSPSGLYSRKEDGHQDASFRSSLQCTIMPENPFCRDVSKYVRMINDDFLNINVFDYCTENHFLQYDIGGKFNRHKDIIFKDKIVNHISAPIRKITSIVLLSDHETFEGGKFVTYTPERRSYKFEQGDLIIFPSYVEHQVEELTAGVRYSTVHWSYGGF